tara:strand:- start:290 stop:526 length:237 start_codon:yes stop_codon:yes gene_type:complete
MTKIALYMIICSVVAGECMAPVQMDEYYDDMYSCLNAGYKESLSKSVEIGRSDVNEHEIYMKFICREIEIIIPPGKPV